MNSDEFSRLYQFVGAYFNEDWMCEYEVADDVVRSFLSDSTEGAVVGVKVEIRALLKQGFSESELRDFLLKDMSSCYCYWHDWSSGEEWLRHILVLLGDEL